MSAKHLIDRPRKKLSPRFYRPECKACPRLVEFLDSVRTRHPDYACRPVPSFGGLGASLLIVGLAPGLHGANASGRPFTGDHAGILLYQTLYKFGFSSAPDSHPGDDLVLKNCAVTNAVKCLPPENKPIASEVNTCRPFLIEELGTVPEGGVILALGKLAHDSVVRALGMRVSEVVFGHASEYRVSDGRTLLSSYHCSRYNTQTGRLTGEMFENVFSRAQELLG